MKTYSQKAIDLSHTIEDGMVTYHGLPAPVIGDYLMRTDSELHYAPGTTFQIGRIEMIANTGTYIDAPSHRYEHGADIAELSLCAVANLQGVRVTVEGPGRAIEKNVFEGLDVTGHAVLVYTGWAVHWRTEQYHDGHPYLTAAAAEYLVSNGAVLVGIDSLNIDDDNDGTRPAHTVLLRAGIPIVEHLRGLELLPENGFRFFAVPVKVRDLGSFPVRAFAILD